MGHQRVGRGSIIASILVVVGISMVVSFAVAQSGILGLRFSLQSERSVTARYLAESVVLQALAVLMDGLDAEERRTATHALLGETKAGETLTVGDPERGLAVLTFDPAEASRRVVPWSLTNFHGTSPAPGWNRSVPEGAVDLIATATSGNVVRHLEAVVTFPIFPFTVASDGGIDLEGSTVGALQSAPADPASIRDDQILPGGILSNGTGPSSMLLRAANVVGDARTCGDAVLEAGTRVQGEVQQQQPPLDIPRVSQAVFDPGWMANEAESLGPQVGGSALTGYYKCPAGLHVGGSLQMNDAVVVAQGDLTVDGGVQGRGALVASGKLTIHGQTSMVTTGQVVMMARGDVELGGNGPGQSLLAGTVYCEGSLRASDLTLIGHFISHPSSGTSSVGMRIDNCHVYSVDLEPTLTGVFVGLKRPGGLLSIPLDPAGVKIGIGLRDYHSSEPAGFYDLSERRRTIGDLWDLPRDNETFHVSRRAGHYILETANAPLPALIVTGYGTATLDSLGANILPPPAPPTGVIDSVEVSNFVPAFNSTGIFGFDRFAGELSVRMGPPYSSTDVFGDPNHFLSIQSRARVRLWTIW